MRTPDHINQFRNKTHPQFKTEDTDGMNGFFVIPLNENDETFALVIASESNDIIPWEHVSARIGYKIQKGKMGERAPNWDEMCLIKELFWQDDEVAVQFHPKKEDYINVHPFVLHLWRPTGVEMPMPPKMAV